MRFMGDEVYVYHYKMAMKEAANSEIQESGRSNNWEWHQDYGYWYNSGALLPDFASCWIAVDEATRENGCLKVLQVLVGGNAVTIKDVPGQWRFSSLLRCRT